MILLDVLASRRQVIDTYPSGGGAYAVSIAAGLGALTSAFPAVGSLTVPTCLGILAVITLLNLRGLGDGLPCPPDGVRC